ncbi:MAG: flagellar assembly protein FliW [Bacteroidetes bacterium]|nr:flagellar assembly protein FliW [Bacteroidota bacterium]MCL5027281.1 flagellar assembly protein FliW [Chloroflexota bacterium]
MPVELVISYEGEDQVLTVDDDSIISFQNGLVGFQDWKRFVLLEDPDEAPLAVLQCVDDTAASFLVTDPACVAANYRPRISMEDLQELGLARIEDGRLLCILAAKEGPVRVTANLLGPIIVNTRTRRARQVVLQDSRYSAQHPVLMAEDAEIGVAGSNACGPSPISSPAMGAGAGR